MLGFEIATDSWQQYDVGGVAAVVAIRDLDPIRGHAAAVSPPPLCLTWCQASTVIDTMSSDETITTRTRIMTAARALLEERGFDVGMGDIARRAGISRQAVYLHFESKTDLLQQLTTWVEVQANLGELLAPV